MHMLGDINANGVVWASMASPDKSAAYVQRQASWEDVIIRKRYLAVSAYYLAVARSIHALFS